MRIDVKIFGTSVALLFVASISSSAVQVAKVNGRQITDKELKSALSGFNEYQQKDLLGDPNNKRQIVESLVEQELLVQMAENLNLEKSPEYQEAMNSFRRQHLANLYVEKKLGPQVSESAAKKFYEDNKIYFSTSQVKAMHILTKTEADAKNVLKLAQAQGADFQELAEKYSIDPSAKNNRGDIGWFTRDMLSVEFTDAAFSGQKDQIVGPVRTAYGYHIIRVVDRRPGKTPAFNDIELKVKAALRQNVLRKHLSELRSKATIELTL